ncbi:MAG: ABC transporter permease, partial [Perlabentimonas sp.]
MYKRYIHDVTIAVESILANKLKSMLTALGIIFGVAAVISMMAIGNGAQQEILDQMKMVGVNNIIINPIFEEEDENSENGDNGGERERRKFSPGLTLLDVEAIQKIIPSVKRISPEISLNSNVQFSEHRMPAKIMGVSPDYFELFNLPLEQGTFFNTQQLELGKPVCIIGANISSKFFNTVNPIGQYIKFGHVWLQIIGVLQRTDVDMTGFESAGVNVYNDNV